MIGLIMVVIAGIGGFYGYRLAETMGAVAGGLAGGAVGLVAGILIKRITGSMGGVAGDTMFGGRQPNWSLRERLGADLSQARHLKEKERFDDAIRKLNEILEKDPDFPEALLLKARILWEARENLGGAKRILSQVISKTPESGALNREATAFYRELVQIEKFHSEGKGPGR